MVYTTMEAQMLILLLQSTLDILLFHYNLFMSFAIFTLSQVAILVLRLTALQTNKDALEILWTLANAAGLILVLVAFHITLKLAVKSYSKKSTDLARVTAQQASTETLFNEFDETVIVLDKESKHLVFKNKLDE